MRWGRQPSPPSVEEVLSVITDTAAHLREEALIVEQHHDRMDEIAERMEALVERLSAGDG